MRSSHSLLVTLSLAATATVAAGAQQPAQTIRPEPSLAAPIFAGLGLGAVGFIGGAVMGAKSSQGCSGECELGPALLGALIGETFGVSLGAHLGNRQRGNYGLDLLTSAAVAGVGAGVGIGIILTGINNNNSNGGVVEGILLLTPIVQLVSTVAVERSTGRARERRAASLSVMPMPGRRLGIMASVPLP